MKRQAGVSLVELMVAMSIGVIVILAAVKIYVSVLATFQQVDTLSRRQETVLFVTQTLIRDIRNASSVTPQGAAIRLTVPKDPLSLCDTLELEKRYYLNPSESDDFSLTLSECREPNGWRTNQPLMGGFYDDTAFLVEAKGKGHYQLTLQLNANNHQGVETLVINVQNRQAAMAEHKATIIATGGE